MALTLFDLRRLGKVSAASGVTIRGINNTDRYQQVDYLGMVGVNGGKFPAIRQHLDKNIGGVYKDMNLT